MGSYEPPGQKQFFPDLINSRLKKYIYHISYIPRGVVNWKLLCQRINSGKHDNTHSFQFWPKPFLSLVSFSYFTVPSPNPCQVICQVFAMLNLLLVHACRTIPNVITQNEPGDRAHRKPWPQGNAPSTRHIIFSLFPYCFSIKLVLGLSTIRNYYSQQDSQNVSGVCKTLFPHTRWNT